MPEPVPDIVYHYTSIDTMMKIVASESIFATSVCYLNDTSEQTHFLKLVRSRIPSIEFATPEDRATADSFLTVQEGGFESRPFIASFSAEDDSLPQWRSYCGAGNGVAVGFSTSCLSRAALKTNTPTDPFIRFGKVKYPDTPDGYPDIDTEIVEYLETAKWTTELMKTNSTPFLPLSDLFTFILLQHAYFRKSASFRSENEYRLVADTIQPRYDLLRYRTSRSCMIPFLELEIPRLEEGHDKDPFDFQLQPSVSLMGGRYQFIKRVVVGPTPNMPLTVDTLKAFFRSKKLQVDVEKSNVSFRDW